MDRLSFHIQSCKRQGCGWFPSPLQIPLVALADCTRSLSYRNDEEKETVIHRLKSWCVAAPDFDVNDRQGHQAYDRAGLMLQRIDVLDAFVFADDDGEEAVVDVGAPASPDKRQRLADA